MKKKILTFAIHAELVLMSIVVIIPVMWILLSAFQSGNNVGSLDFTSLSFKNFKRLFDETSYALWFLNTLKIALISTVFSVFLIMLTSWVMSRFKFKGRKTSLLTIMILSMFPTFLSMTAIYTLFLTVGLIGKPISLVIIYSIGAIPYNTWLVKGYLDGIPTSIDEAAYIDGCNKLQTFKKIVLPMAKPIITYCAVSQFMLPWMDYILPNMLLSNDKNKTLAVGLFAFVQGRESTYFGLFAAGAILIAIPITLVFMIFQRYLVQGVAAGADKG